jgi:hypothetical protein
VFEGPLRGLDEAPPAQLRLSYLPEPLLLPLRLCRGGTLMAGQWPVDCALGDAAAWRDIRTDQGVVKRRLDQS